jgi:hypothetical protein
MHSRQRPQALLDHSKSAHRSDEAADDRIRHRYASNLRVGDNNDYVAGRGKDPVEGSEESVHIEGEPKNHSALRSIEFVDLRHRAPRR